MNADLEPVVNVPGNLQVMENIVINPVFIDPDILVGDTLVELLHQVFLKAVAAPGDVITRKTIAFSQEHQEIPHEDVVADGIRFEHQQAPGPGYPRLAEQQEEPGSQVDGKGEIPEVEPDQQFLDPEFPGGRWFRKDFQWLQRFWLGHERFPVGDPDQRIHQALREKTIHPLDQPGKD